MGRLYPDSHIAYKSEIGPFAQKMTERDKAVQWLVRFWQGVDIECFGGYYGPVYRYKKTIFIVDPGHESQKYAGLEAWKERDVIKLYRKFANKNDDDDDWEEIYNAVSEAQTVLEGI